MLTSHYLLSGFVAVSCATGLLSPQVETSADLPQMTSTNGQQESLNLTYRGSGRLDENPVEQQHSDKRGPIAHRGSGRIYLRAL